MNARWVYQCPSCKKEIEIPWKSRKVQSACPKCKVVHLPPTPQQQTSAVLAGLNLEEYEFYEARFREYAKFIGSAMCVKCSKPCDTVADMRNTSAKTALAIDDFQYICFGCIILKRNGWVCD